jgi:hypothetical protein
MPQFTIKNWQDGSSGGTPLSATAVKDLETRLYNASKPPLVSAIPASPSDADECYYQSAAMATLGLVWHFRYRASAGTYKWEFVGGSDWLDEVVTDESLSVTNYTDLTTVGPQITVPLAGEYEIFGAVNMYILVNNNVALTVAPKFGGAATAETDRIAQINCAATGGANAQGSINSSWIRRTIASANTLVKLQYRVSSVGIVGNFRERRLRIRPVRVA